MKTQKRISNKVFDKMMIDPEIWECVKILKEQPCLIEQARKADEKRFPPHLRPKAYWISCPCPRCTPRF